MTTGDPMTDRGGEARGNIRASHLLSAGAFLLAVGALSSLAALSVTPLGLSASGPGTRHTLVYIGWLAYMLGLVVVGGGFGWSSVSGVLPRVALAAALLHLLQGFYLMVILFGSALPPISPVTLTTGRLLAVFILAVMARAQLGKWPARALGTAGGLGLLKALVRVLAPQTDRGAALDAVLLLFMAVALWFAARQLRNTEDGWVEDHRPGGKSDFSDFNNPEHEWNKTGTPPALQYAGRTP